jgi:hypothetical protein
VIQVFFNTPIGDLCIMESTNNSLSEVSCNSTKSTARSRFRRGMSLKAIVAKAAGWTLKKAKDVTSPESKECKTT